MNAYWYLGLTFVMAVRASCAVKFPWSTWWRMASPPAAIVVPAITVFAGYHDSSGYAFVASSFGIGCAFGCGFIALAHAGVLNEPVTHPRRAIGIVIATLVAVVVLSVCGNGK